MINRHVIAACAPVRQAGGMGGASPVARSVGRRAGDAMSGFPSGGSSRAGAETDEGASSHIDGSPADWCLDLRQFTAVVDIARPDHPPMWRPTPCDNLLSPVPLFRFCMTTDPTSAMPAATLFAPFDTLAAALLSHVDDAAGDGAHDLAHLTRVWRNVCRLQREEGGDLRLLLAAVLLHDCVRVEKDSPLRSQASRLSAQRAGEILAGLGWPADEIAVVAHAVAAHSFSAGIAPQSREARILQDADRLDAIGAIGVARCFYIAGRMQSALYDPADASAAHRPLDDRRFALDHFPVKLFTLADGFQTTTGADIARERKGRMHQFVETLMEEI